MKSKILAGFALALSLLAPAFSAPAKYEVGALQVEQVSTKGPALILIPGTGVRSLGVGQDGGVAS